MEVHVVLKSEIRSALTKVNRSKAKGPGEIVIGMLSALDDFGINKISKIRN